MYGRIKIGENEDGTWFFYNQTEGKYIIKNGTEKEVRELKKLIDSARRSLNRLHNGIR